MTTITAKINAKLALEAMIFASEDETRYYLHGFCIEKHPEEGVLLITTDGHRMSVIHDPEGELNNETDKSVIVKIEAYFQRAIRDIIEHDECFRLSLAWQTDGEDHPDASELTLERSKTDGQKSVSRQSLAFNNVIIDGNFPDWRRVTPDVSADSRALPDGFNTAYIAEFSKFSRSLNEGISIQQFVACGPCLVRVSGREDMFGVLMPIRMNCGSNFPEWFQR